MNGVIVAQEERWTAFRQAVQEQFREGGSLGSALMVAGILVAIVLLTFLLTRRQERSKQADPFRGPARLFHDLLSRLSLSGEQRRILQAVARKNQLPHPTVVLLSPTLFDRYIDRYRMRRPPGLPPAKSSVEDDLIQQTRNVLFPEA